VGRLDGKVAVITGTSGGQGRAAALAFAREGARVIACARNAQGAQETAAMVRAAGGEIDSTAPLDLCDNDAVVTWIERVAADHGGIDILYNNAGEPRFGSVGEMAIEDWHFTIRHELDLMYFTTRAAWPHLARSRSGASLVNIASIAGIVGLRDQPQTAHAASKHGVVGMTLQMAAEGAPLGIRANSVSPGLIDTPATTDFIAMGEEGPLGTFMRRLPLGRAGRAEEVVNAALFLASDEASYITGVNLVVDGGSSVLQ
jgi:NAD(P)-dependent dehydrogenase (short-subunit alcohol dehydrogenase family)